MMWSVVGLALSTYYPNRYLVYCIPFVSCYVLEHILEELLWIFPSWAWLPSLGESALAVPLFGNAWVDFFYIVLLFTGISLLLGVVFVNGVKRRMRNEIV